jgi:hypothetical protein
MTRKIRLVSQCPDEYLKKLHGKKLNGRHYDLVVGGGDVDVLKPDGKPLLLLRHSALPPGVCGYSYLALRAAAKETTNRGVAAGGGRKAKKKKDGTITKTTYAEPVDSGILGFYDRVARFPFCRTTAYAAKDLAGWGSVLPFLRAADRVFAQTLPDRYAAQRAAADRTPPEWVVPGTVFTTVTFNHNYQSACHTDKGDLKGGSAC